MKRNKEFEILYRQGELRELLNSKYDAYFDKLGCDEYVTARQWARAQERIFIPFCEEHKEEFDPSIDIDMIKELLGVSGQFNKNLKEPKGRYIV